MTETIAARPVGAARRPVTARHATAKARAAKGVVAAATDAIDEVTGQTTLPLLDLSDIDAIYGWIRDYLASH